MSNYKDYLNKHISAVKVCYKILTGQELTTHDESKLSPEELEPYDNYFYPEANGVKKDEHTEEAFDYAWLHHQNTNRHHWQYWVLLKDSGETKPLDIPLRYINEMVADWGSFAYQKGNGQELLNWYNSNKDKMVLTDSTRRKVELLVGVLAERINERKR